MQASKNNLKAKILEYCVLKKICSVSSVLHSIYYIYFYTRDLIETKGSDVTEVLSFITNYSKYLFGLNLFQKIFSFLFYFFKTYNIKHISIISRRNNI